MADWELYGYIREEDNKYYQRNLVGEEGLVYDFNVNIGDTFELNNPMGFTSLEVVVIGIDSIFIEPENEYRKRITLFENNFYYYEEYWIEGMGSSAGVTQSSWDMTLLTGGDDFTLLCYYENDELLYMDNYYSHCFYPIVGISSNIQKENKIKVFPNPVKNVSYLEIDYPDRQNLSVKILDLAGNVVEEFNVTTPTKVSINSINYPKGVYFYQVSENNQAIANDKFIVH